MSFNWTDYLAFAEALLSDPDTPGPAEAAFRSAASRAYYAAFHEALAFAQAEGYVSYGSGDDHRAIQRHFRQDKSNATRRKIALELSRALDFRREADYFDTLNRQPSSLAHLTIGSARAVIQNLDALRSSSD
jgi:uncharacterized protein (UPF0332 family)